MHWRRPPFALVLTAVIGLSALAVVLLGGGGPTASSNGPGPTKSVPGGHERACLTTRAQARVALRGTVRATATAVQPLRIVHQAQGSGSAVTVTRTASFSAKVGATRVVDVTQTSVASGHACASAASVAAARGLAIQQAFAIARARAHSQAVAGARRGLRRVEKQAYPGLVAQAQSEARQRARAQAAAARPALTAAAHNQAVRLANRTRAGGH